MVWWEAKREERKTSSPSLSLSCFPSHPALHKGEAVWGSPGTGTSGLWLNEKTNKYLKKIFFSSHNLILNKREKKITVKKIIWLFKILDPSLMDVKSWTREGFFGQKPLFVPLGTVWHRDAGQCVWLKKRNISMWDINNIISDSSDQRLTVFLVFIDQSV